MPIKTPIPYYTMDLRIDDTVDDIVDSFIKNNHLEDSNLKPLLLSNINELINTLSGLNISIHRISSYVSFNHYKKDSFEQKFVFNENKMGYYPKIILINIWRSFLN